jgi:hypothetical protein
LPHPTWLFFVGAKFTASGLEGQPSSFCAEARLGIGVPLSGYPAPPHQGKFAKAPPTKTLVLG